MLVRTIKELYHNNVLTYTILIFKDHFENIMSDQYQQLNNTSQPLKQLFFNNNKDRLIFCNIFNLLQEDYI